MNNSKDNRKVVYIDMDGVVADFKEGMRYLLPSIYNLPEEERHRTVNKLCQIHPDIFLDLRLIEGAEEGVGLLNERYNIFFLSTPMWHVPASFMYKRIWLERKFNHIAHKKLILTHAKNLHKGHCLIDDHTWNGAGEFEGMFIHFGSKEYPDWDAVLKELIFKPLSEELAEKNEPQ